MEGEARSPEVLAALRTHLEQADPLLAAATRPTPADADDDVGRAAAGTDDALALTVEAVREGQLVHAGTGRLVDGGDPDLAILAGDHLYAFGLGRLAADGDLAAVAILADTIAACARAHAEGAPGRAAQAWARGAAAIAGRDRAR